MDEHIGITRDEYDAVVDRLTEEAMSDAQSAISDSENATYDVAVDAAVDCSEAVVREWLDREGDPAIFGQVVAFSGDTGEAIDWEWRIRTKEPGYDTPDDALRRLAHVCLTADVMDPIMDRLQTGNG